MAKRRWRARIARGCTLQADKLCYKIDVLRKEGKMNRSVVGILFVVTLVILAIRRFIDTLVFIGKIPEANYGVQWTAPTTAAA